MEAQNSSIEARSQNVSSASAYGACLLREALLDERHCDLEEDAIPNIAARRIVIMEQTTRIWRKTHTSYRELVRLKIGKTG